MPACETKGSLATVEASQIYSHVMQSENSEEYNGCESPDETSKQGLCWTELKRAGLAQWGTYRQDKSIGQQENRTTAYLVGVVKQECDEDDKKNVKAEANSVPERMKRKRFARNQSFEDTAATLPKVRQSSGIKRHKQNKHGCSADRWSTERYKLAEQHMLEIMRAKGAVLQNPISRPSLRDAARKVIGDTGLLDHLLKHIDGKVAPGGAERFRRCYNTSGVMEYWLENADLVNMQREDGPTRIPQSCWKPGNGLCQESACAEELKLLKEEISKMRRDMDEMAIKQTEQDQANPIEEIHKELVKWKAKTDQRLMEISSSLGGMQDMYQGLVAWKSRTEQQLLEISKSLSSLQASKQCTAVAPLVSEKWEDWLESTNLDSFQGDDLAPWLDSFDVPNVGQEGAGQGTCLAPPAWSKHGDSLSQGLICTRELDLLREETANRKRDVRQLIPRRQEDDQANVTPDSSVTAISKLDIDNSLLLFQETLKEMVKWKAKIEQQLSDISSTINATLLSRQ